MTAQDAIKRIKIALGMEKFAEATLVDGTIVRTEGELAPGEQLQVVAEDGTMLPAPEGTHETQEGKLVTVDAAGVIVSIEDKPAEEVTAEEEVTVKEEAMGEEEKKKMEDEEPKAEVSIEVAPEMVQQVIDAVAPLVDQVKELETELKALKASFSKFSDEPAAKPVRNNFKAVAEEKQTLIDKRMDALVAIRNKRK